MLFKDYDPLKKKQLSILDDKGKIVNKDLEPNIDKETLLKMYKTMALGRIADIKARADIDIEDIAKALKNNESKM